MKIKITWDYQHTLVLVGNTVVGATLGFFEAEPTAQLLQAFSSWAVARPMLIGAAIVNLTSLLALAKTSYLQKTTPSIPISYGEPPAVTFIKPSEPPPPPAAARATLLFGVLALALFGCTPSPDSPGAADIAAYSDGQFLCVQNATTRIDADACRAALRDHFCRTFLTMPVCMVDGGRNAD